MRGLFLIVFIVLLGGLSGCSKKISQQHYQQEELRFHGQLFWVEPSGVYKGAIPCPNCAGIEVTLDFNSNNTVKKTMRYIKEGRKVEQFSGTWIVQAGNIVQISFPQRAMEFYKAKSGGHLVALNAKKEEEKSEGGQFNIFNKDSMTKQYTVKAD